MTKLWRESSTLTAVVVVALLVAAGVLLVGRGEPTRDIAAIFPRAVGVYEGSDVRIMGLRVGQVTSVVPSGTSVRVGMSVETAYDIPADAKAVVVAPSVVSDRFIQLTPAYDGGPRMAEGAVIVAKDTAVPVELDQTYASTQRLVKALGPQGVNKDGALSDTVKVFADMLDGQGTELRSAIKGFAGTADVLSDGSDDISSTIDSLSGISGQLATYDDDVEELNAALASVADSLAGDADNLSDLVEELARSLGQVGDFVRDNRKTLVTNVDALVGVTDALEAERKALIQVVDVAPLAFTNLVNTYDPATKAVRTRANFAELLRRIDIAICTGVQGGAGDAVLPLCGLLKEIAAALPLQAGLDLDGSAKPPVGAATSPTPTSASKLPELLTGLLGSGESR